MTEREKIRYLKRYEAKLSNRNRKEFKKMFLEFSDVVKKDNSNFGISDINIDYEKFKELCKKYLIKVFEYNVKSVIKIYTQLFEWEISKSKISSIKDVLLKNYNKKYAGQKVTRITETTKNILGRVLTDSQDKGLSLRDTVNRIVTSINNMSETRAKTIARTETSSAINNTSLKTAKSSGMKKKKWIHIGGRYTSRANHKKLNGKVIQIDDLFDLGKGIKAPCPHHQSLPVGEVVNCNCLIIFK